MQQPCQAPETDETPTFQRLGREGAFPSACAYLDAKSLGPDTRMMRTAPTCFTLILAACVARPDPIVEQLKAIGLDTPTSATPTTPREEPQDQVQQVADACVVLHDGPESTVFTSKGQGGLQLGAKQRADGGFVYFYLLDANLPGDWRRRLQQKDVLGTPIWTIDGGRSVSFRLNTVPTIEQYAVTYYASANRVGRTMTPAEFAKVEIDGLDVRSLVLTHQGREFVFPAEGRIDATVGRGLSAKIRSLGWR